MIGNRCSALPVSQYCPQAAKLSAQVKAAGRAAALSTVFHVKLSGNEDRFRELYARLSKEEQEDVDARKVPTDIKVGDIELKFSEAMKETPVGLSANCNFVNGTHVEGATGFIPDPEAEEEAITGGAPDFHRWHKESGTVFVCDSKANEFTESDGPKSLQLAAYALALASYYGASQVCLGIWDTTEGRYWWGEMIDTMSQEFLDMWRAVKAAALNTEGPYATGTHCQDKCYARMHCPAHAIPLTSDGLKKLEVDEDGNLDEDEARELIQLTKRYQDQIKVVESHLKAYTKRNGGIPSSDGTKVWGPSSCKGRESLDIKGLTEEIGEDTIARFKKRGANYDRYSWKKA